MEVGREYAERAFSENDSVEALHVWVLCHDIPQQEAPFRRLLNEFPNSAIAHRDYATLMVYDLSRPGEGLVHIQKAIQLDSRIPPYNYCWRNVMGEPVNTRRHLLSTKVCLLLRIMFFMGHSVSIRQRSTYYGCKMKMMMLQSLSKEYLYYK